MSNSALLKNRFRGFLPVAVDVETGGFNAETDALLEVCATTFKMDSDGLLSPNTTMSFNIIPAQDTNIEENTLKFLNIENPFCESRHAVDEEFALKEIFKMIRKEQKESDCSRAVMVAHNAHFDHGFIMKACERAKIKRIPFHPFTMFDTATLSSLVYGQTVFALACKTAGIEFNNDDAHTALYDCKKTAELFSGLVNKWQLLGGWPLQDQNDEEV